MAKTILGIDFGHDRLKLALMQDGKVKRTATAPMPKNMLRDGLITSPGVMAELIRKTMAENHMHVNHAAVTLADEPLYLRTLFMPRMTEEQLALNLPYEFNDYITGELKDYLFDYSVTSLPKDDLPAAAPEGEALQEAGEESGEESGGTLISGSRDASTGEEYPNAIELLAVAAPESYLTSMREMLHRAGLRLVRAAPVECAFIALIRATEYGRTPKPLHYCFLDLGYRSIRMYMFKGVRHLATVTLEFGLSMLDEVIAEAFSVDIHVAHTYLLNNYEDCQHQDFCLRAYDNVVTELTRALNFFRFSHPNNHLHSIWIFGGGAVIEPLRELISNSLDLKVRSISSMIPGAKDVENIFTFAQAVGITEAFPGADKSFIKRQPGLPFKISVNLAAVNETHIRVKVLLPSILIFLLLAAVFFKFAVYDLLNEATEARREVSAVQTQLMVAQRDINDFGKLNETYYHYTTSGMTEEELSRPDRVDVMEMIREVIMTRTPLPSWSLSGNTLSLNISGATLGEINQTVAAIRDHPLVDYCTVNTASSPKDAEVTASIVIYLRGKEPVSDESAEP